MFFAIIFINFIYSQHSSLSKKVISIFSTQRKKISLFKKTNQIILTSYTIDQLIQSYRQLERVSKCFNSNSIKFFSAAVNQIDKKNYWSYLTTINEKLHFNHSGFSTYAIERTFFLMRLILSDCHSLNLQKTKTIEYLKYLSSTFSPQFKFICAQIKKNKKYAKNMHKHFFCFENQDSNDEFFNYFINFYKNHASDGVRTDCTTFENNNILILMNPKNKKINEYIHKFSHRSDSKQFYSTTKFIYQSHKKKSHFFSHLSMNLKLFLANDAILAKKVNNLINSYLEFQQLIFNRCNKLSLTKKNRK